MSASASHKTRTLWLTGVLHAFTHVYQVTLLPLYFFIQRDLRLESIEWATLLVTAMLLAYFLPSYLMGVLADRWSRKELLAAGLAINAAGMAGLSFAHSYPAALACVIVAGLGGSFFHPAATALIARLFPIDTGKALGQIGIGAGLGLFAGPAYAGWRASSAGWRAPVFELGLAGFIVAVLFAWFAEEEASGAAAQKRASVPMFPDGMAALSFLLMALLFSLRDFTGSSMGSLGSLFLQQARNFSVKQTGLSISCIFLAAAISNPLFGRLSDRGRIRWSIFVLTLAAGLVMIFPRLPGKAAPIVLGLYGFFFMGSYPIIEAALMQAVPDAVRGRIFGLFITVGGFLANISHWLVGSWVKNMGASAAAPGSYFPIFLLLGCLILSSLLALPLLSAMCRRAAAQKIGAPSPAPIAK